jgi:Flp pilus assembly protein TadD
VASTLISHPTAIAPVPENACGADARSLAGQAGRLFECGRFAEAVTVYGRALSIIPNDPQLHFRMAFAAWNAGDRELAGRHFAQTVRLAPGHFVAHQAMADWCRISGDLAGALQHSGCAAELAPREPHVLTCRAWALADAGMTEEAWSVVRAVDAVGFCSAQIAALTGRLARGQGQEAFALDMIHRALELPATTPEDGQLVHLAAAEVLDRLGRYDEAFAHAVAGHRVNRRPYRREAMRELVDQAIGYFTPAKLHDLPRASHGSRRPVFIVGMPRSGTTLVEQILASHPDVYGAGELHFVRNAATRIASTCQPPEFPQCLDSLPLRGCNEAAERILFALEQINPTARYVTDKMPQNFMFLGLIATLFPESHVIHCTRDPLDTCLSCYMTHFTLGHEFAQDLSDLGDYYLQYRRVMGHWRDTVRRPLIEVRYEDVVRDLEGQARRLLGLLDLPWDARCLEFHKTTRLVATASLHQVRRPLYSRSVGRSRNYEKHLGPLKSVLGLSDVPSNVTEDPTPATPPFPTGSA